MVCYYDFKQLNTLFLTRYLNEENFNVFKSVYSISLVLQFVQKKWKHLGTEIMAFKKRGHLMTFIFFLKE